MGFIKNIFSGILSFFIGLFGGKKSQQNNPSLEADKSASATPAKNKRKRNGYFMELEETDETPSTNGKQQATAVSVTKTAETVAAKVTKTAETVADTTKTAENVAAKVTKTAENVADTTKTAEPVAAKTKPETTKTAEPVAATATKPEKTAEPAAATQPPKVQLEQTAEGVKPVPVKPAASTLNKPQAETTFAPKYLNPASSSNGRRRPGPNMTSFLDMARQVKTPG